MASEKSDRHEVANITKSILILTADVGYGHRSAANAIAAALKETYGERCAVQIENPLDDPRSPSILREVQTDYDRLVRQMPDAYKLSYQVTNEPVPNYVVVRALIVLLYRVLSETLNRIKPDAVVVTNQIYSAPLNAVIAMNRWPLPYLTTDTDLTHVHRQWFYEGIDLLLVPTQEVFHQALESGFTEERVCVTGIPINPHIPMENRSQEAIRAQLGWEIGRTTVLVVGSKRVKNLEGVLQALNHSGLPVQLVLVAGGDDALFEQFENTAWHLPVYRYNYIKEMPAFLHAADCILSKAGGLIVSESLACGLPLLFVDVTPGQEEGNAEYVVRNGAGEMATEPIQALETLFHWLDKDRQLLELHAGNAHALGKPRSAFEAADLAWEMAQHGRVRSPRMTEQALKVLGEMLRSFGISSQADWPQIGLSDQAG